MAAGRQLIDPNQKQADAALALAEAAADGDPRRTIELFTAFINVVDRARASPEAGPAELTRLMAQEGERTRSLKRAGLRRGGRTRAGTGTSIYSDPTYIRNAREVIKRRARVVGGVPTVQFSDCVAVGHSRGWCCSGTLVAPNVVVTAAHCSDGCASRVFIGTNVKKPKAGRVVRVRRAVVHPKYDGTPEGHYDLMVLVLDEKLNVTPRRIATARAVARAKSVRLVGFGATDIKGLRGYGVRRVVDVPMAAPKRAFGARASIEFVAGAPFLDRDSCNGDSGGPAYVAVKGGWAVAGATSRATTDSDERACGDGGIYTRLPAFSDWIRSVPGGNWKA